MTADADTRTDATDGAVGPPHEDAGFEASGEDDASTSSRGSIHITATPAIGGGEVILELAVETASLSHFSAGEELDADAAREVAALLDSYAAAVDE